MIEVFKTNVKQKGHAKMLIDQIHKSFSNYKANFDLDDRDKILRVKSTIGSVQSSCLVELLKHFGFHAEVLPDLPLPARVVVSPGPGKVPVK